MRVDLVFSFSAYEQEALSRVEYRDVGAARVAFVSVEDLVVHKVVAGRPRDLEDVRAVILKNPSADWEYVRRWLREFESTLDQPIVERFESIRKECAE